ncbi:MAG: T9SS type A sorting domain-containing protein [Bacteroidetes bacterium]|jgi:hypothetical protein|nr:T9SS type A sorting domain-containing protein [Bacteroidota bacterium]
MMMIATPRTLLHRCIALCACLLLLPLTEAHAQIELTGNEVRALIESTTEIDGFTTESASSLQALVDASGGGQTYDFTSATFEQTLEGSVELLTSFTDVPGADDAALSDAGVVLAYNFEVDDVDVDSTAWIYQDFDDDGVYQHGLVFRSTVDLDGDGSAQDEIKLTYSPRYQTLALPLTFGTSWTSETTQTIAFAGQTIDNETTLTAEVDGYGTLVTPAGEADCLRIRRVLETSSFGGTTTTVSYEFITETGMSANLSVDATGQVTSASYTTMEGTGTDVEPVDGEVPRDVHLAQNYPNPFNPQTTIRYEVPEATHVRLAVYDMLGREVEVLVDRQQPAGTYRATFAANDLPSGVYLYQLDAGTTAQTRRMLLLK